MLILESRLIPEDLLLNILASSQYFETLPVSMPGGVHNLLDDGLSSH
jgi:hypothetical protein